MAVIVLRENKEVRLSGANRQVIVSAVIGGGDGTGSVTSVGLSLPNIFTVSGSPVTGTGTLSASLTSQSSNLVLASPDGSAGIPVFRELTLSDIPNLPASKITSGLATVAISGNYNDLNNRPSIPPAQVNSDWNATTGLSQILNKPTIPTQTSQLINDSRYGRFWANPNQPLTQGSDGFVLLNFSIPAGTFSGLNAVLTVDHQSAFFLTNQDLALNLEWQINDSVISQSGMFKQAQQFFGGASQIIIGRILMAVSANAITVAFNGAFGQRADFYVPSGIVTLLNIPSFSSVIIFERAIHNFDLSNILQVRLLVRDSSGNTPASLQFRSGAQPLNLISIGG